MPRSIGSEACGDVTRLARAFESATQCYKFLFFRSLLDRVASSDQRRIALVDILADISNPLGGR